MTTYIVKENNDLHIYQSREDQQAAFLQEYGEKILFEGDSIQDVLLQFNRFPVIIEPPA
jgi:hypothetical protein